MHGEILISGTPSCNEMIFGCANCPFGCVATMIVRRYELIVDLFVGHEVFECLGAFVIEPLQFGAATTFDETFVNGLVRIEEIALFAAFGGSHEDGIAVVIADNEKVVVAIA